MNHQCGLWHHSSGDVNSQCDHVQWYSKNTYTTTKRDNFYARADYQEYKISEKDFRNLHPNDFEDLFLLIIQEKLNHLPKTDKTSLHTAVNMWIRNLVIRNRVGDLQLGIESYQTKINSELQIGCSRLLRQRRLYDCPLIQEPASETKKWSEDDKIRRQRLITAIEKSYKDQKDPNESRKALVGGRIQILTTG
ncbi:hypothetical protein Tco_0474832 [Tanacetum coccineum]